ncbi:MAG: hypothetical protein H6713_10945 [Myxococcales bacterium]|nr:hypothetical protein [Myxococcales bacterium]MCB9750490.1 hypothetical protein [Myxococcales bacterium]
MKKILSALGLASLLAVTGLSSTGCEVTGGPNVPRSALEKGGVYVAYNNKYECTGCEQINKGDLILALNGSPVSSRADLRLSQLASGSPVKLSLWRPPVKDTPAQELEVEITAKPNSKLPPIEDAPPMFLVGASKLNEAPDWARKTLFGHASVATMLVNANGGILDGRQLYGKKHMILFWDWATREEQAQAAEMLQVLQLAQADLNNVGVDILFTHIQFPGNDRQRPMNDGQLRDFHKTHGKAELPGVPLYRFPNSTEYNKAREIGLEGSTTYIEYLRASPSIVLLDEGGIIRWHSEGIQTMPSDAKANSPTQYTIIEAIKFAQKSL